MDSRGLEATQKLRHNLEEQLDRLVAELADLEEYREELGPEDYEEKKADTLDQLKEFDQTLKKMVSGNMTLVDQLGSMQLAIQAAISEAFKTPEVIRMFAKKQPGQLRERLHQIERDSKFGKISPDTASQQKLEILMALRKLGDQLSPSEHAFLETFSSAPLKELEALSPLDSSASDKVLEIARSQYKEVMSP